MAEDGTYPPLDVPKPLAEGAWVVDGGPQRVLGLALPTRMTVLRLADGGLWLHSPTRHTPALEAALAPLGPVRHLVAPNTAHWVHVSPWQKAFPEAKLWAAPGVADRAHGQGVHLRAAGVLGDPAPPPDWDGQIEQAAFSGPGFIEVVFHHRASRTLVLTDIVQAMRSGDLPLATRLFSNVVGSAAPEGATPAHVRLVLNRRRAANRAAAERLLTLAPERVVFAHGAFYAADGAARLRRALEWLLRD
ncbi:MAG: hypothetical protein AVDCRST_MAG04-1451 [uncultured Acetobacteraceae bacterium]|uniref:Methanol oxidation genes, glmU-like n=1 Tax=uncultured Acetobacteraceae bacterium TaxID=169975 RepID=A0A6J4I1S1_9PROT|nr:MAG: hypothetical protein AVDCRST_MAG04-1451 [uncultured Acetobacteraceae bacterium]